VIEKKSPQLYDRRKECSSIIPNTKSSNVDDVELVGVQHKKGGHGRSRAFAAFSIPLFGGLKYFSHDTFCTIYVT
jgi:hypothetical protein